MQGHGQNQGLSCVCLLLLCLRHGCGLTQNFSVKVRSVGKKIIDTRAVMNALNRHNCADMPCDVMTIDGNHWEGFLPSPPDIALACAVAGPAPHGCKTRRSGMNGH